MLEQDKIDDDDALNHLDQLDKKHGVNTVTESEEVQKEAPQKVTSLGKPKSYDSNSELSAAEESPWKLLNQDLLPTRGMFYPDGSEILLRSAKTKEIRHWSTMDENDPIDVREKINYILNACSKFKIKGKPIIFNFNDYCEVDRYHLLFRIYELTFPNQENKLFANIKSDNDKLSHINRIQVTSQNLKGFEIPEELVKWYSPSDKCFVVPSSNLNETLRFYMPTVGMHDKFKNLRNRDIQAGRNVDEAFYKFGPYLMTNWKRTSLNDIVDLKLESTNKWNNTKFNIVYKFTEALRKASHNVVMGVCEKTKKEIQSRIFLRGSFTVKDIFIISTGLDELIGA